MSKPQWTGYTPNYYARLQEMRISGELIDRVTTAGTDNPYAASASGSRLAMWESQRGQFLPLLNPDSPQQLSGTERELAKGTWDVRLDCDHPARILEVIPHYRADGWTVNDAKKVSYTVVYQDTITGELGLIEIPYYYKHHTAFGYTLRETEALNTALTPGREIDPGTILKHGRSRLEDGSFAMGKEANFCFYGAFGTNEDACIASEEVREMFKSENFKEIDIYLQEDEILTNTWGDKNNYIPLPPIGTVLKGKGKLATKRKMRNVYDPVNMSKRNLMRTNLPFDLDIHSDLDAEVIDIQIIRSASGKFKKMPQEMCRYLNLLEENVNYRHRRLLEIDERHRRDANYARHPSWHIGLVAAEKFRGEITRKAPPTPTISDKPFAYQIRITTRAILTPRLGYKYTNKDGGKFVIGMFMKKEDIFTDQWGRTAHFVANPSGISNRNNQGQLFHQYNNDACFHARRKLLEMTDRNQQMDYLMEFYRNSCPESYHIMIHRSEAERWAVLDDALKNKIEHIHHIGDPSTTLEGVQWLMQTDFRPPRGKVTFRDASGARRTTKSDVRIAPMTIVALEKIGAYSSACNIPVMQSLGFAAKLDSSDKKVAQHSEQSNRLLGESELRNLHAHLSPEVVRYMQRSSSAKAHREMVSLVYDGHKGLLPKSNVDASPSRGVELGKHYFESYGFTITTGRLNEDEQ